MLGSIPVLSDGPVVIRPIRLRDARQLERELIENRSWLRKWEASSPNGTGPSDVRAGIRSLQNSARAGVGMPFVVEVDGELSGQLNVSQVTYGSLSSATIGYWVSQRVAGRGVMPTAVALATDHCFRVAGLHRMEICIRPENLPSLRVVQKLGFRYEGLRRRYIHIDGDWRDHFCFALVAEEVREGVLQRWQQGRAPADAATVPEADVAAARTPLSLS